MGEWVKRMLPGDSLEGHSEVELAVQALLGLLLYVAPAKDGGSCAVVLS